MSWQASQGNWATESIPEEECTFYHLLSGLTGRDAPTGQWGIIMACLIRYCGLKNVVELGVWKGATTVLLADACRHTGGRVFAVDTNDCIDARLRIRRLGLQKYCEIHKANSWEIGYSFPVDLLFIDAGHRYDEVKSDWHAWYPRVKQGGYIFIDNTHSEVGVQNFMAWLLTTPYFLKECQFLNCTHSFGMAMIRKRECDDVEVFLRLLK
jgi:hypothetical protein